MTTHKQEQTVADHEHINHKNDTAHHNNIHAHDAHAHSNEHNSHDDSHNRHENHSDHTNHDNHDEHGDHAGHGHGGHGHGGGHGDHGGHGGGHGDHGGGHGDHGGGSKVLGVIGVGAIFGLIVLLGIPTLFSQVDHILGKQTEVIDSPGDGLLSSYTVANARDFHAVKVVSVVQQLIDTPKSSMPVIYITLSTGERFMAMDMSAFKSQGVSSAAIFMSKEAYQRVRNLTPGKADLRITGEPPLSLMLAGITPVVIGVETR